MRRGEAGPSQPYISSNPAHQVRRMLGPGFYIKTPSAASLELQHSTRFGAITGIELRERNTELPTTSKVTSARGCNIFVKQNLPHHAHRCIPGLPLKPNSKLLHCFGAKVVSLFL